MTATEKKSFRGYSKNAASQHKTSNFKKELPANFVLEPVENLPEAVDWRSQGVVTAVKDQGMCGSCWAFASTAVMESHVALASGLLFDLSPEQMAMCAPNPDSCGGTGKIIIMKLIMKIIIIIIIIIRWLSRIYC
jgi:cathepsin L